MTEVHVPTKLNSPEMPNKYMEKILDSIDEAVAGVDRNGYINIFNSASERREKIKRSQVINKHVEEVYDFHGNESLLLRALKEGKPILDQYQEYTVSKSGQFMEIVCSTVPVKDGDEIIGAVSVMKDYSKVKKLSKIIMDLQTNINNKNNNDKSNTVKNTGAKNTFGNLVGNNKLLLNTISWAKKTAENNMPVLIFGETGTGKELFAQSIHSASNRKNNPYIAINCAAIPENLLESILFGTAKGAFTGSVDKPGLFEHAEGGTLVLDEINSMPLSLQSKLLRVVQEETVTRVGEVKERPVNVRLISISNTDPSLAIASKQLREDLYYRIAYISIEVPPLRKRLDDLHTLIEFFMKKYNKELKLNTTSVSKELYEMMANYEWPGNIRELEHILASGMSSLNNKTELAFPDLPSHMQLKFSKNRKDEYMFNKKTSLAEKLGIIERIAIEKSLHKNNWNISKAARDLGLKRQCLQHKIKKYSVETK